MSPVSSMLGRCPSSSPTPSTRMTSDRSLSRRDRHPLSGHITVHTEAPTAIRSPAATTSTRVPWSRAVSSSSAAAPFPSAISTMESWTYIASTRAWRMRSATALKWSMSGCETTIASIRPPRSVTHGSSVRPPTLPWLLDPASKKASAPSDSKAYALPSPTANIVMRSDAPSSTAAPARRPSTAWMDPRRQIPAAIAAHHSRPMRLRPSSAPAVAASMPMAASQWIGPVANDPAPSRIAWSTTTTCSQAGSQSTAPIAAVASGSHAASNAPTTAFG